MVRTFLANWLHNRPSDSIVPNWAPVIPTDTIEFLHNDNHGSLIWECQCLLQESIASMDIVGKDMPSSANIILLFILAQMQSHSSTGKSTDTRCPDSLSETADEYASDHLNTGTCYIYSSPFAPQNVKVSVLCVRATGGNKIIMKLVAGNPVEKFVWADWIDVAMGYMKGKDAGYNADCKTIWRIRTPSKCDLSRPLLEIPKGHPELPELPGNIRLWTGWPLFDIKVVQIGMNQWMEAAGFMNEFGDIVRPPIEGFESRIVEEFERAESGLLKILEWNRS